MASFNTKKRVFMFENTIGLPFLILILSITFSIILPIGDVFFQMKIDGGFSQSKIIICALKRAHEPKQLIEKDTHIVTDVETKFNNTYLLDKALKLPLSPAEESKTAKHIDTHYVIFKDVIATPFGTIISNNTLYAPPQKTKYFSPNRFVITEGFLSFECEDLVGTGNQLARRHYGHCFTDVFFPLTLIPQDIREKAYILCSKTLSIMMDGLLVLGFSPSRIIFAEENMFVYAKHFHTLRKPLPFLTYFGSCPIEFRRLLYLKYDIHATPSNYFIYNRRKTDTRYIANFDELVINIKNAFPQYNWLIFPTISPNLQSLMTRAATAKFFYTMTGSNSFFTLAMQPGTVCVYGHPASYDLSNIRMAIVLNIFNLVYFLPGIGYFTHADNIINCSVAVHNIEIGLDALKHKKWKTNLTEFCY